MLCPPDLRRDGCCCVHEGSGVRVSAEEREEEACAAALLGFLSAEQIVTREGTSAGVL